MNLQGFSYYGTPDPKDCGPFLSIRELQRLHPVEDEGWPPPAPISQEEYQRILVACKKHGERMGDIVDQMIMKAMGVNNEQAD